MKTKTVFGVRFEFKADGPVGSFRAVFATFNVKDHDGDVTLPGAFTEGQPVRISVWNHGWGELPPGRGEIHSDQIEAWVDGQFFMNTNSGREHYETLKSLADLTRWSYGYEVLDASNGQFNGESVQFLKRMDVIEVSPVMQAAGINTRTITMKEGRRNSAKDAEHIQAIHDGAAALGATCNTPEDNATGDEGTPKGSDGATHASPVQSSKVTPRDIQRRIDFIKRVRIFRDEGEKMNRKELVAAFEKNVAELDALATAIQGRVPTEQEEAKLTELEIERKGLVDEEAKIAKIEARIKSLRETPGVVPNKPSYDVLFSQPAQGRASEPAQVRQGRQNIGKAFVESEQFKGWLKQIAPNGYLPESDVPASPPVGFKTLLTGESDTSAGAFVQTDHTNIYEPLGRAPLSILNLITRATTGSDTVDYVRQTAKITQAAMVPEANVTNYAGATGEISGLKPEGAMAFELLTEAVKTQAVWIPASRRAMSDVGQLMSIINGELNDDLIENLEYQMTQGDGIGSNFTGIFHTQNVLNQPWVIDFITTARKAKTALRTTGRTYGPLAWLLNPEDKEMVDLLKDGSNRYYWGGPFREGTETLWGAPMVECEHVTQGIAVLGQWSKAKMWDREASTIRVSEHHDKFFIHNMIAVLAEMRAAFAITKPSAFILVETEQGT
jgi:HK97 family phage major capsid protein